MAPTPVSREQLEILQHTARQRQAVFCGDSPAMQALVGQGLMKSLGRVSWCPDEYFGITQAGRDYLKGIRLV